MKSTDLKMLFDKFLVEPGERKKVTQGGIHIPESAGEPPLQGTVLKVGPGSPDGRGGYDPLPVQPGDRILYGKLHGQEFDLEDGTFRVLQRQHVLGIFNDDGELVGSQNREQSA